MFKTQPPADCAVYCYIGDSSWATDVLSAHLCRWLSRVALAPKRGVNVGVKLQIACLGATEGMSTAAWWHRPVAAT